MVSYQRSIESLAVPKMHRFEITDFKNAVTLKTGSVKVIENVTVR